MASGWADDNAVNEQIRASIEDEILRVRNRLPKGEGAEECEHCGDPIPAARRAALPGVRLCVECQAEQDAEDARERHSLYNRRANKDSQIR